MRDADQQTYCYLRLSQCNGQIKAGRVAVKSENERIVDRGSKSNLRTKYLPIVKIFSS